MDFIISFNGFWGENVHELVYVHTMLVNDFLWSIHKEYSMYSEGEKDIFSAFVRWYQSSWEMKHAHMNEFENIKEKHIGKWNTFLWVCVQHVCVYVRVWVHVHMCVGDKLGICIGKK